MNLGVTGHRPDRLHGQSHLIYKWCETQIINYKPTFCLSGMAGGTDQLFASAALSNNYPLWCLFPYRKDVEYLNAFIDQATRITYTQEKYSKDCYFLRDKYLVDNSDVLLAVWDKKEIGGTWFTIKYARSINKPIVFYYV